MGDDGEIICAALDKRPAIFWLSGDYIGSWKTARSLSTPYELIAPNIALTGRALTIWTFFHIRSYPIAVSHSKDDCHLPSHLLLMYTDSEMRSTPE